MGERLTAGLQAVQHPLVAGVRGRGLWLAVALTAARAPQMGVNGSCRALITRMVVRDRFQGPPLILRPAEADEFLAAWPAILDQEAT